MRERAAGTDSLGRSLRPAGSGSLDGQSSGDAAIAVTFSHQGAYRFYMQVGDELGRWSPVFSTSILVDRSFRGGMPVCP